MKIENEYVVDGVNSTNDLLAELGNSKYYKALLVYMEYVQAQNLYKLSYLDPIKEQTKLASTQGEIRAFEMLSAKVATEVKKYEDIKNGTEPEEPKIASYRM
jgi:hypothetical protein